MDLAVAEEDALPLEEITQELASQYLVSLSYLDANLRILIAIIMCIVPADFPDCCQVCGRRGHCVGIDRQPLSNDGDLPANLRSSRDSVARFMVKRLARHCSCKC